MITMMLGLTASLMAIDFLLTSIPGAHALHFTHISLQPQRVRLGLIAQVHS